MSTATETKEDRRYTKDHEWAKLEGDLLVVGISAFAVDQLGDVTLVNFDVKPSDRVEAGKTFGTIESVKTLSDLFAPVAGEIVEINDALENAPELVNEDCWSKGWMLKIRCNDPADVERLLTAAAYTQLVAESD